MAVIGQTATASSVNIAWDANPEPDIVGYKLSYGTSPGNYSATLSTGTTPSAPVSGLNEGRTYYFVVKAVNTAGLESAPSAEVSYQVPVPATAPGSLISRAGWTLHDVSSEEAPLYAATLAFDGNPSTFWHTEWINSAAPPPHEIVINLGMLQPIGGFRYLPRQDNYDVGNIARYEFYVSLDGINWGSPVASGTFTNSKTEKEVLFPSTSGLFVKLREITEVNGSNYCNVAELNLIAGDSMTTPQEPVNQAPVAAGLSASTSEDTTVAITLSASDADGNPLSYRVASGPSMGTLSGTAPNLIYTPAVDANGSDSFTFAANDGKVDSNIATVSITVVSANDAPTATAQTVSTTEDTALGILLAASDKDGDSLSYQIISGPAKGTLSGTAPNLTYTPNLNASGTDSFSFRVSDGKANSNTATVYISISPVNDAPVASAKAVTTTAGTPMGIVISASDADGDALTYSIGGGPAQGSLSGTAPNLTYTPNPTAIGTDSFSFRANDGKANSNSAIVSITITSPVQADNKVPFFQVDLITRAAGKVNEAYVAASLAGSATDPDGSAVSYSKVTGPTWLSVAPDGNISGTPPVGSEGLNSFTIRATDPNSAFDEAVLQITIEAAALPLPWSLGRIGAIPQEATAWGESTAVKIKSPGSLDSSSDSGLFTWQTLSGDGEITARISALESASSSSLIGLEIRESLGSNSKHVFIGTDGNGSLRFIRRIKSGTSATLSNVGSGLTPDLWLRLVRGGSTVSAFKSVNGSTWTRIGKVTISPGASSYIGLMVCGGNNSLSTGTFQNITVKP